MNDYPRCPDKDAVAVTADPAADPNLIARYKRASLAHQAQRAAWDLGALVRRVEYEAPGAHRPLLAAVKVLQQLALQHGCDHAPPRSAAAAAAHLPPGSPRQGELF